MTFMRGRYRFVAASMLDPLPPKASLRSIAAGAKAAGLRWMYLLVSLPLLTELVEAGQWPVWPRGWLTEIVAAGIIALLVRRVRVEHLSALAQARTDALTSLLNRRAFEQAVEDDCARARRSGQALSLVFIDLDSFKLINDRLGHDVGDRVLQQLATAIRASVRARVDRGFRLGGDEFAVLLPGSSAAQLCHFA